MRNVILLFTLFVFLLSGCATSLRKDLSLVSIGMSKADFMGVMGKPDQFIGAKRFDNGVVEIFQYTIMQKTQNIFVEDEVTKNWFFFLDGELDEWGPKEQYTHSVEQYLEDIYYKERR